MSLSDNESESTNCRSGRDSRDRSSSRCSRNSSVGSQTIDWNLLCQFENVETANDFLKNQLPKNATRTSRQPICKFYDKQSEAKHKMVEQICNCYCNDVCPVEYRFRKCISCDHAEISQANDIHVEGNCEAPKATRGIDERVKKIIEEHYTQNIRSVRPIDIFTWLNLEITRDTLMKGLLQPKLHQI